MRVKESYLFTHSCLMFNSNEKEVSFPPMDIIAKNAKWCQVVKQQKIQTNEGLDFPFPGLRDTLTDIGRLLVLW